MFPRWNFTTECKVANGGAFRWLKINCISCLCFYSSFCCYSSCGFFFSNCVFSLPNFYSAFSSAFILQLLLIAISFAFLHFIVLSTQQSSLVNVKCLFPSTLMSFPSYPNELICVFSLCQIHFLNNFSLAVSFSL